MQFEDANNEKKGIYQKERRMSPIQADARDEFLTDMKSAGGVERALPCANYAMPFVLVAKTALDGTWTYMCVCSDVRRLNPWSKANKHRTQTLDEMFASLEGHTYLCSLDAKSGYVQVGLPERTTEKLTFQWKGALWRYTREPFGPRAMPGRL